MQKRVRILGTIIPMWLVTVLLIASGAGAVAGAVVGNVTGEIHVSTAGGGGAIHVGEPIGDIMEHTPNVAIEDKSDADTAEDPTGGWPMAGFTYITSYANIAFSDDVYEETPGAAGFNSQQMFKFYVGDVDNISQIDIAWEGKAATSGLLQVWEDTAWDTDMEESITNSESTIRIAITESTDVTIADAVDNEYVYVQVYSDVVNEAIYTDYVTVTVTYAVIDFLHWVGFSGPPTTEHIYTVPDRWIGVHADDQSAFQAAAEISVGDWWVFILPIKNASRQATAAKLTLNVPTQLNVDVVSADQVGDSNARVTNATRIGLNTWKFKLSADAAKQDDKDYLYIIVNAHDNEPPGMYTMTGKIEQIAY